MIEAIKDYFCVVIVGILGSCMYVLIEKKACITIVQMILKVLVKSAVKYFIVAGIVVTLVYHAGKCVIISSVEVSYDYCASYMNYLFQ